MSPLSGSIHRKPRRDSGAARLWDWACVRDGSWTAEEAATVCSISIRHARKIVRGLHLSGWLDCTQSPVHGDVVGQLPALWIITDIGRRLGPPIMVETGTGNYIGVRSGAASLRGRPTQREEVEVTPEMIEAGKAALSSFNTDYELLEDAVIRIYEAMASARLARPS